MVCVSTCDPIERSADLHETLAWIVAPVFQQSGMGGKSDFTTEANLTAPSQYDLIPAGAPSVC